MEWLLSLLGPAGPVLVGLLAVILLILRPFRNRRMREREATGVAASRLGMLYQPPQGDGGKGEVDEGSHRFTGETDGIAWSLETVMLSAPLSEKEAPLQAPRCYVRWTTGALAGGGVAGEYLLLMNLMAVVGRPEVKPGVLDELLDKMALLTLFLTIRAYFGEARADGIVMRPGHRWGPEQAPQDRRLTVFCNSTGQRANHVSVAANWMLDREDEHLAILWDRAGLAVSAPVGWLSPVAVALFAQGCVDLVKLLSDDAAGSPGNRS